MGSNLILQLLQGYVIAKAGKTHGSRTTLYRKVLLEMHAEMSEKQLYHLHFCYFVKLSMICFGLMNFSAGAVLLEKITLDPNNHLRFHTVILKQLVQSYNCLIFVILWAILLN